jgi:hypothetical protein
MKLKAETKFWGHVFLKNDIEQRQRTSNSKTVQKKYAHVNGHLTLGYHIFFIDGWALFIGSQPTSDPWAWVNTNV